MFSRNDIQVRGLASGANLSIPVFTFEGTDKDAPSVYIQSGIHGAELQGHSVCYLLIKYLSDNPPLGNVTIVPQCNPYGMNQKSGEYTLGRFDSTTGTNWNRAYLDIVKEIEFEEFIQENKNKSQSEIKQAYKNLLKSIIDKKLNTVNGISHANKLCYSLQRMAHQADYVLDLHTGPLATRYLYALKSLRESAKAFNIPHTLLIGEEFAGALDEACFGPWLYLEKKLKAVEIDYRFNFEAYTVELGSEEKFSLAEGYEDITGQLNFLTTKGVINFEQDLKMNTLHSCDLNNFITLYAPCGGQVNFLKSPGEKVKEGDKLCEIINLFNIDSIESIENNAVIPVYAPKDGIIILHHSSSNLHEGTELFSMMTEVSDL